MLSTVLLVILILLLIGALPRWQYSSGWGYYPSGGIGLIVLILIVLAADGPDLTGAAAAAELSFGRA